MRHRRRGFSGVIRLLALLLVWAAGAPCWAQPASGNHFSIERGNHGPVLRFSDMDYSLATGAAIPAGGWMRRPAEPGWTLDQRRTAGLPDHIWARVRFDRAALGPAAQALFTENNREGLIIFVNGTEAFRNYGSPTDPIMGWNHPYFVPLSGKMLRPGINEIVMRVESPANLSVGSLRVGASDDLAYRYSWQYFWKITAPLVSNGVMAVLSAAALLLWLNRRHEPELLMLALSGAFWFMRDYHFFAERTPFDTAWFITITNYVFYFAVASSMAFCLLFLRIANGRLIAGLMFAIGALLSAARLLLLENHQTDVLVLPLVLTMTVGVCILVGRSWWRTRSGEQLTLLLIVMVILLASFHDAGRLFEVRRWEGLGFLLHPFIGPTLCIAFMVSFGRRAIGAFSMVDRMNVDLIAKIAQARSELLVSEARRHELEVARALEGERERLMREMHDGIGSGLASALAVAERQRQPQAMIATLRRALADLKITVDSLEPVEGDVVALLASFRHRMIGDLDDAGLVCRWQVEPCQPLPWLDATNALQLLRIFQEALANVLSHAGATEIEIGCRAETRTGRAGVLTYLNDNGGGTPSPSKDNLTIGKGLLNMRARAAAIHAEFEMTSRLQAGTSIRVWLPAVRPKENLPAEVNPKHGSRSQAPA